MIFLELFMTFFVIGIFTIGGGYAMLSIIQAQVVTVHNWIDEQTFTDIIAISQMTPGPIGINSATYIGYSVLHATGAPEFMCVLGSFTTTVAAVLPSFIIVLSLCHVYARFNHSSIFEGIMSWLRPAIIGLIGAAALVLLTPEHFGVWTGWILFIAAFFLSLMKKTNPILIILSGGLAGFFLY